MPCFIEHALHVSRMLTSDEDAQLKILREVMRRAADLDMATTPPEMAREIHKIIREVTGVKDPYLDVKDKSTDFALELLPSLRKDIADAADPFEMLIRVVIAGNIIDYGADIHFKLEDAYEKIRQAFQAPLDLDSVKKLKRCLDSASNILYISDNCGEAVFDRLLIEPYASKLTLAVRGAPILNDLTLRELEVSGLAGLPKRVITTGDCTPGVSVKHSSPEFLEVFNSADLIIAKGQGNYESMSDTDRPIFFLFRAKCKVIRRLLDNVPHGSLHVISANIP